MKVTNDLKRAFFFHFNKPASRAAKRPQISVHWKGACYIVDNIQCHVPCAGRINEKRQPHFVMAGKGKVEIVDVLTHRVAVII